MSRRFSRTTEDFACLVCGTPVRGDGYTNHCPRCLWSRHVDVHPGDRAAGCGGLMAPVGLDTTGGRTTVEHRCERCGHARRNRLTAGDDQSAVVALATRLAERAMPPAPPAAGVPGSFRDRARGSGAPRRPGRRR